MLEVDSLDAWYGQAQVLFRVSLAVGAGECVALVGRNGAGKSTTMKAIMGLMARRRGTVVFRGRDISSLPAYRIARLGLGWVPEDRRVFTDLSVRENLAVARQPPREGAPTWSEDKLYALFPNLRAMPDRLGGRMSGGEQQMLTVARTLMGNPSLVLLDEPSEGVAPPHTSNSHSGPSAVAAARGCSGSRYTDNRRRCTSRLPARSAICPCHCSWPFSRT